MEDNQFVKNQIMLALSFWDKDRETSKAIIENLVKTMWMEEVLVREGPAAILPIIDAELKQTDKFRYAGPGKKGIDWLLGRKE